MAFPMYMPYIWSKLVKLGPFFSPDCCHGPLKPPLQCGNCLLALEVAPGLSLVNIKPLEAQVYAQGLFQVVGKVRMAIYAHFRVGMLRSTLTFLSFSQKPKQLRSI